MKTLADFRREMKVGTRWEGYHYGEEKYLPEREVKNVDRNRFSFYDPETNVESGCNFPKSSHIEFDSEGWVNIYFHPWGGDRFKALGYKKV